MDTPDAHTTAAKVRRPKAECCAELTCESGLRNNYFAGKRLTTESFRVERDYFQGRRWLLNRAIHGWGVVYGYPVTGSGGSLTIGAGLALAECGRELLQVRDAVVELADVLVFDDKGHPAADPGAVFTAAESGKHLKDYVPPCWLLSVHYAERDEESVRISDPCSCERGEWDRTCETVRYSLRQVPCHQCCEHFDCELTCDCAESKCCEESVTRGGCRCLCDHLTGLSFGECGRLSTVDGPCGSMRVDLRHRVALACVTLVRDECQDWSIGEVVDACGPRHLVKRNDLLYDLIRGCDLTRISEIGWAEWHRGEVPFDKFSAAWGPDGDRQREYVTDRFWVRFSRPVRVKTLLPDCFVITIVSFEREGGWKETRRVPIVGIKPGKLPTDPAGHASEARVVVDGRWLEDAVRGTRTIFGGGETWLEIEVRGDFIVDCNGQTVDANAAGLSPAPTGNGTPGGTFISSFRVEAEVEAPRAPGYDSSQHGKGASS